MYPKSELLKMYEQMVLGRRYEEKIVSLLNQGKLAGFFHLAIGQEAIGIGVINALGSNDYYGPTHRSHPALASKLDLKKLTCELLGKSNGYNKGKAFTFHVTSVEDRVLPVNGILGAGVPTAAGVAWALKVDKKEGVVVCTLGDGACSEGNVYEGMNIAALFKLPIVFVIENNGWAVSNPVSNQAPVANLSQRAAAYGMKGATVDGNDVVAVRKAVEEAIKDAREGHPGIVEARTYRWRGHFEGDPCPYRDPSEVEEAKKNCPLKKMEKLLLEGNMIAEEQIKQIDQNIMSKVEEAFQYAENSPLPTPEETLDLNIAYATNLGGDLL